MKGLEQSVPKVLISQNRIPSLVQNESFQSSNQSLKQMLKNDIYVAVSKYSDSLMIIINQTNSMGSIYRGRLAGEVLPQIGEQDDFNQNQDYDSKFATQKIYEIKCLFGSTQIQFYELLVRKILQVLFEQNKTDPALSILVNISLPVKFKQWSQYETKYYQSIIKQITSAFKEIV